LVISVLSTAATFATFLPPLIHRFLPWTLLVVASLSFAWANFLAYEAVCSEREQLAERLRGTQISVAYAGGWYDVQGPNPEYTQVSLHFRLELSVANRDSRSTTVRFLDLTVPGQSGLEVTRMNFFSARQGIQPVLPASRSVDVAAGQTLPTVLEIQVSVPNADLSPWGETVNVELRFVETFGGDLEPLAVTVPLTP
jgi:hypothetical protein